MKIHKILIIILIIMRPAPRRQQPRARRPDTAPHGSAAAAVLHPNSPGIERPPWPDTASLSRAMSTRGKCAPEPALRLLPGSDPALYGCPDPTAQNSALRRGVQQHVLGMSIGGAGLLSGSCTVPPRLGCLRRAATPIMTASRAAHRAMAAVARVLASRCCRRRSAGSSMASRSGVGMRRRPLLCASAAAALELGWLALGVSVCSPAGLGLRGSASMHERTLPYSERGRNSALKNTYTTTLKGCDSDLCMPC